MTFLDPALFRDKASKAARLLRSMGNEHRLMILCRLGAGEMTVGELQVHIGLSQSALLRDEGLVTNRREGQSIHYRIADPAAIKVIMTLAAIYCPEMLDDLDQT